jgi:CysZ protein
MSLTRGIRAFFDGVRAARAPGLRRYTWLPVGVSLLIIVVGLTFAFDYLGDLAAYLTAQLPEWLAFLSVILVPLLYLLGILMGAWLLALLAVLVASPFLGELSAAVERLEGDAGPVSGQSWWAGAVSAGGRELRKLAYYLPRLVVVFLVTLIPLVNAAAPIIWFGFGAWVMAVQFCDYPNENRGRPFRDTVALLQRNRATALGYGSCATLAMAVPLLNFLLIPAAVAGGTLLWRRLVEAEAQG